MAFDLKSITKESRIRAPKGIIYGPPGIGKTTFGASVGGLIVDAENGIPFGLQADHTTYFSTWKEMKDCLDWATKTNHSYGAIVIDTVDWMLRRIEEEVAGPGLTDTLNKAHGSFGNGKQVLRNYVYHALLPTLDKLVNKGIAVVMLAHAARRELTNLEGRTFERSIPQIHPDLVDVMIEWSDFVGAACMISGERSLMLQETNQVVAKNRYGITQPIRLTWNDFVKAINQ